MQRIMHHRLELLVSFASLALLAYFAWQGFAGPRSVHYQEKLSLHYAELTAVLATVSNHRGAFESRVQMLRPESMDADLADQLARETLNVGATNELVVRLQP